eukprot:7299617-Alexandrium_andersonii.AAC.1
MLVVLLVLVSSHRCLPMLQGLPRHAPCNVRLMVPQREPTPRELAPIPKFYPEDETKVGTAGCKVG